MNKYYICIYLDSSSRTNNPCISKTLGEISLHLAMKYASHLARWYIAHFESGYIVLIHEFEDIETIYF